MPNQILIDLANALRQASIEVRAIAKRKEGTKQNQSDAVALVHQYLEEFTKQHDEQCGGSEDEEMRDAMLQSISDNLSPMGIEEISFGDPGSDEEVILKLHPRPE